MITSLGRNIYPEAVETAYRIHPQIQNVMIFADQLPHVVGVVVTDAWDLKIATADLLKLGQESLPEICRIQEFHFLTPTEAKEEGFYTVTGRPLRSQIWQTIQTRRNLL